MSAGAVRAPLIIPLRIPTAELPKSQIDTNTKLEIISETPNTTIYFTINGSRPVVKKNDKDLHNFGTQKFRNPFTLPVGTQTVRALAFLPETGCESNVVTKRFEVSKANCATESGRTTSLDDYAYLDDLKTIEYHRKRTRKAILDLPERDHSVHRSAEKNSDKPNRLDVDSKLSGECYSSKSHEELNAAGDSGQPVAKVDKATSHTDSVTDAPSFRHVLFDSSSHLSRLQQRTDLLHCPNCFNPRSPNQSQKYCVHCGRALPVLPTCAAAPLAAIRLGSCPMCHSKVPLNLPVCLICESPLKPPENPARRQQEYRVCAICGTVNPLGTLSCWTCEGRLATGMENLILHSTAEAHHIGPPPSPPVTKPKEFTTATDIYLPCPHCRRENNPDARYCDWCGLETASLRVLEPFSSAPHTRPYAGSYDQQRVQFYAEFSLTCSRCGSVNLRHAQFCAFCGFQLPPPDRQSVWSTPTSRMSDATIAAHSAQSWVAPGRNAVVSNASTQTVGLFYPSAADLRRKESCLRSNPFTDAQLHHRTPLLTAVSPGRGTSFSSSF
ncbi:unnamed protein product [Dicrocoelium dendriticum]|nr:unnamed protein product [Dicrocoelium dendriticum]